MASSNSLSTLIPNPSSLLLPFDNSRHVLTQMHWGRELGQALSSHRSCNLSWVLRLFGIFCCLLACSCTGCYAGSVPVFLAAHSPFHIVAFQKRKIWVLSATVWGGLSDFQTCKLTICQYKKFALLDGIPGLNPNRLPVLLFPESWFIQFSFSGAVPSSLKVS